MIIFVESKIITNPEMLKAELIKLGFKQTGTSGSSIEYSLVLGKYYFFVKIPKNSLKTYYQAGYLVGGSGPDPIFKTATATWEYIKERLLPEITKFQKSLHSVSSNQTYWGVERYGIDGADTPKQYSVKDALEGDNIVLFNSRTDAATYASVLSKSV